MIERAKRGDLEAALFGRFQNGQSRVYLKRNSFDFDIYFCHNNTYLSYFLDIALNLQEAMHRPHLTHLFESISREGNL